MVYIHVYTISYLRIYHKDPLNVGKIPSRELTYPPKMAFWRWFSFSQGGICWSPGGYTSSMAPDREIILVTICWWCWIACSPRGHGATRLRHRGGHGSCDECRDLFLVVVETLQNPRGHWITNFWGGIKQYKSMVNLSDLPCNNALFGLVM